MLTPTGPHGRGSIPALVMRTGLLQPVSPENARQDLRLEHVEHMTDWRRGASGLLPQLPPSLPMPGSAPTVTPLLPAVPSPVTTFVAQTTTATPPTPIQSAPMTPPPFSPSDRHHWHLRQRTGHPMIAEIRRLHPKANLRGTADVELGEWNGRPLAKFEIASAPTPEGAHVAAGALRRAAHALRAAGLASLSPELIAGPLAALMRGGAVALHFQNGVVIRTAL
jgi:hypothetical protein